jgi:hypothetical protein
METKSKATFKPDAKLKLMDQVRQVLRYCAKISANGHLWTKAK